MAEWRAIVAANATAGETERLVLRLLAKAGSAFRTGAPYKCRESVGEHASDVLCVHLGKFAQRLGPPSITLPLIVEKMLGLYASMASDHVVLDFSPIEQ